METVLKQKRDTNLPNPITATLQKSLKKTSYIIRSHQSFWTHIWYPSTAFRPRYLDVRTPAWFSNHLASPWHFDARPRNVHPADLTAKCMPALCGLCCGNQLKNGQTQEDFQELSTHGLEEVNSVSSSSDRLLLCVWSPVEGYRYMRY